MTYYSAILNLQHIFILILGWCYIWLYRYCDMLHRTVKCYKDRLSCFTYIQHSFIVKVITKHLTSHESE